MVHHNVIGRCGFILSNSLELLGRGKKGKEIKHIDIPMQMKWHHKIKLPDGKVRRRRVNYLLLEKETQSKRYRTIPVTGCFLLLLIILEHPCCKADEIVGIKDHFTLSMKAAYMQHFCYQQRLCCLPPFYQNIANLYTVSKMIAFLSNYSVHINIQFYHPVTMQTIDPGLNTYQT